MPTPTTCDICSKPFSDRAIDARTKSGQWGLLCPKCHAIHGVGLGLGKGQEFTKRPDGEFWKVGTGPTAPQVQIDRPTLIDLRKLDGQCDPHRDAERLRREFGLTDSEIATIRPAKPAAMDDDPWDYNPEGFTGGEFASEGH